MRVPHAIRPNEPLRQLSLVMYAHDDCQEALDTLFRHANNISLGSEYTLIMLYAQENDPVFRFMNKYIGISVRSEMYLFSKEPEVIEKMKENSSAVLFDLSMTIWYASFRNSSDMFRKQRDKDPRIVSGG